MGADYSCCVREERKNSEHLLNIVDKYRRQVWYLPIYDVIKHTNIDDIMEQCPLFYHEVAHYEEGQVNFDSIDSQFNKFQSMNTSEKQLELQNLISRCYVVLDQQQLPLNAGKLLVPHSAERHLFSESIVYDLNILEKSAVETEDTRKYRMSRLRQFDPEILKKFNNFASFCEQIRAEFAKPFSFLSQMFLNFKAQMLTSFQSQLSVKSNFNNLDFKERFKGSVTKFILLSIQIIAYIYKLQKTYEDEGQYTFFTNVNIFTLITSVIFEDSEFNQIVMKVYKVAFLNMSEKFKNKTRKLRLMKSYNNQELVNKILKSQKERQSSKMWVSSQQQERNINQSYKNRSSYDSVSATKSEDPLYPSIRMLDRLAAVPEPILKLKVFYQSGLQAFMSIQKLKQKDQLEFSDIVGADKVNQTILKIVQRLESQNFILYTFITHDFIHQDYRMGRLGCSLAPFLISIEKLST